MGLLISTPTPAVGGSAGGASGYAPRRVLDRSALVLRDARLTGGLCDHRPLQRGVPHGALPVHAAARAPPRPRPCRRMHRATATIAARVPRRCPSCAFEPCAHPRANSSRTVGGMAKPRQGTGTHKFRYGTYTGEWGGGKRHGQGVMVLTNGDRCVRHEGGCAGG